MFDADCLDGPQGCQGDTAQHYALSGSGLTYPRCEFHYGEYVARVQPRLDDIARRYPCSPPEDFDETFCGETW